MNHDEIDRILAAEDEIQPSSGFAASVMHAVRSEASAPAPIPFPWKRALPGVIAGVVTLALLVFELVSHRGAGTALTRDEAAGYSFVQPIVEAARNAQVQWIVLALLVTLASVSFSIRIGSRGR